MGKIVGITYTKEDVTETSENEKDTRRGKKKEEPEKSDAK